jgi:hypothetical protein
MPGQNILPPFPRQTTNHGPQHARAHKRARETTPKPRHHATQARTEPVQTARRLDDNATTRQPRTPTTRTRAQARNPFASTAPELLRRPFERGSRRRARAPGASTGYVASRMALPRHAQGSTAGGEHGHATTTRGQGETAGSRAPCVPCELAAMPLSLAMHGRLNGLAARGSGPRPGGSSARAETPGTPSAGSHPARA